MRRSRLGWLVAIMAMAGAVFFLTSCTPEVNAELKTYSGINAIRDPERTAAAGTGRRARKGRARPQPGHGRE